jgi:hypothetical protein
MLALALTACRVTEEEFCPADSGTATAEAVETVETAATELTQPVQTGEEAISQGYDIGVYRNGENREGYSVTEETETQTVEAAIFNYMIKSAAWPGVDVDALDLYIHIVQRDENGETSEYYVYEKDGAHCMQAGKDGMYSTISDEAYQPLYELAMGWHTPHTMMITSGEESVYAVRNWVSSKSVNGLYADGMRLTPQQVAAEVNYITLAEDFAPYVDGEMQPGVAFTLYNEEYEEVEYPIPSGLAAWTYIGHAGPGRYIAKAEMGFEEDDGSHNGYQYFFGLVVPERNE